MNPVIETIAIGDEILNGRISDTNSTFVSNELFKNGFQLTRTQVVPDDDAAIDKALRYAGETCDVVVVFGGLGPTSDDRTAECVARLLETKVVEHLPSKERLIKFYEQRARPITTQALKQILYPETAVPMLNLKGMAPGFHCHFGRAEFFFLPGVPAEMKALFSDNVLPFIQERSGGKAGKVWSQTWRCLGIWESDLQRVMDPVEGALPKGAWLGYRTKYPENHLSLYFKAGGENGRAQYDNYCDDIRSRLGEWTYTEDDRELEQIVLKQLAERGLSLALAESCTGGLTVQRLTRVPGASDNVWGGFVCYQVAAKNKMLGVTLADPEDAVSEDCTRRLAEQTLKVSGCDLAASITGYMGPNAGKDPGTLGSFYLCVKGKEIWEKKITLPLRSREEIQWGAATYLLNAIRMYLEAHPR